MSTTPVVGRRTELNSRASFIADRLDGLVASRGDDIATVVVLQDDEQDALSV